MKRLTWWRRCLLWLGRSQLRAPAVEAVDVAFDKVRVSRDLALAAADDFLDGEEEVDPEYCPRCGWHWACHNDDGSCVQEEDDS